MGKGWLLTGILGVLLGLSMPDGVAQGSAVDSLAEKGLIAKAVHLAESTLHLLTFEQGRHSVAVFPAVGYTPRTGIEYGLMPVWRIKPRVTQSNGFYRPTTVTTAMLFSTTGMFEMDADIDWRTTSGWVVTLKNQYLSLPDKFYGVNNRNASVEPIEFDAYRYQLNGQVMKGLNDRWMAGIELNGGYTRHHFKDGVVIADSIAGYKGGWANAAGPVLVLDTRDNVSFPSHGTYCRLSWVGASSVTGSRYAYSLATFDGRLYHSPFRGKGILASQFYTCLSAGDVPFYQLPQLGGKRALRGIPHPYKYMGKNVWYFQSEYRQMIWWRLGAVAFAGAGSVFGDVKKAVADTRLTAGVGLRVQALPGENLNFRIDYGWATGGDKALYFTIREAF
jgi:outer membrane protein assembly factor BamA